MIFIVTPCSRIENLETIYQSLKATIPIDELIKNYRWVVVFDKKINLAEIPVELNHKINFVGYWLQSPIYSALAGHGHRNFFLNTFFKNSLDKKHPNSWVYFLDDDTVIIPEFHKYLIPELLPERSAVIFNQFNKDYTARLYASRSNIKVCHIDMGQYVVNMSKIENHRFIETDYCADGIFIETLFNDSAEKETFFILPQFCSVYNALQP